jgi:hypothetical protein
MAKKSASPKKTAAQLEREIAEALAKKRYRLVIAGPTGRYTESHFTTTKDDALAQARRELERGAVHVRVESVDDALWGNYTPIAQFRKK